MRAQHGRRARGDASSFWISYSDLMASMLFVFALILFFSIYQLVDLQEKKTAELETQAAQLATQQSLLLAQETELKDKEEQLATSSQLLEEQQTQLDEQAALLALTAAQLEERETAFDAQSVELEEARLQIALAQQNLDAQQAQIDNLIGVRSRIIEDLRDEMRSANLDTVVDRQTGAITFTSSVLFDYNSSDLKDSGKAWLDSFLPVYVHTLLSEENQDYVAEIIIEGHADMSGDYLSNLNLSQQRALSVVSYFLSDTFYGLTAQEKEQLRSIVTANGRSWVDPVYNEDGTVNMEASRRVEFKFRLKDAEMIAEMSSILEQND